MKSTQKDYEKAVRKTLLYFAHFSYAPSFKELHTFLDKKISIQNFKKVLNDMESRGKIVQKEGLYTLGEYSINIARTLRKLEISAKKKRSAGLFLTIALGIPSIKLIGFTGSISMNNASLPDDIDFFIVTHNKKMWITRLLCLAIAQLLGKRRKRAQTEAKNKICLNLFFDEGSMDVPKIKMNEYIAHEILQLKPIINRNSTYEHFLAANSWVFTYFPNALKYYNQLDTKISKDIKNHFTNWHFFGNILEHISKSIQLHSIQKHTTTEIITETQLWFFPNDYERKVIRKKIRKV